MLSVEEKASLGKHYGNLFPFIEMNLLVEVCSPDTKLGAIAVSR
jgi:hypothetical protein